MSANQTAQSEKVWKPWLDAALAFVYPNVCQICGDERAVAEQGYVCNVCRQRVDGVKWIEPPFCSRCGLPFDGAITNEFECAECRDMELHFDYARASVKATQLMLDCMHRYKYSKAFWIEKFLIEMLLGPAVPALAGQKWDYVAPVPLHPVKQRAREFNQAERLARPLAEALNVPLNTKLLRRVQYTETQTALSKRQRTDNMKNAFAIGLDVQPSGARVLLVDDILTTGATTSACAKVLRDAGAGGIGVWTLARATKNFTS